MQLDYPLLASEFIRTCEQEKTLSQNTLQAYAQDLSCFRKFQTCHRTGLFDAELVLDYLSYLREAKKLKPASVRRRILTLRSFAKWLNAKEHIEQTPFARLELELKLPKRLPRPVERHVVTSMITAQNSASSNDLSPVQTTSLIIKLMIVTGVRVGELSNIRVGDVTDHGRRIRIRGKGNRERNVFVGNAALAEEILAYRHRRTIQPLPHDYLFINRNQARLSAQAIRTRLKKLSQSLDISPPITPHQFRHSAATFLIEEGVDIRVVQRLLGHSSIATTEIYTRVSDASLMHALSAADPLQKLSS